MRHRIVPLVALVVGMAGVAIAQELRTQSQAEPQAQPRDRDAATQPQQRTAFRAQTDPQQTGKSLNDAIAACLILGNHQEIALAKLAQQHAQSAEVKEFAQMMMQEHQQANSQLQQFAPQGVSLELEAGQTGQTRTQPGAQPQPGQPRTESTIREAQVPGRTTTGQAQRTGQPQQGDMQHQMLAMQKDIAEKCLALTERELSQYEGQKFDQAFIGQQVAAHIGMVAELEGSQKYASGELQQIVEQQHQTTQKHLQHAKQIMQQLEGQSRTAQEEPAQRQ